MASGAVTAWRQRKRRGYSWATALCQWATRSALWRRRLAEERNRGLGVSPIGAAFTQRARPDRHNAARPGRGRQRIQFRQDRLQAFLRIHGLIEPAFPLASAWARESVAEPVCGCAVMAKNLNGPYERLLSPRLLRGSERSMYSVHACTSPVSSDASRARFRRARAPTHEPPCDWTRCFRLVDASVVRVRPPSANRAGTPRRPCSSGGYQTACPMDTTLGPATGLASVLTAIRRGLASSGRRRTRSI